MNYRKPETSYKEHTQLQDAAVITGYRYSATGVYGYYYYLGEEELCSISGDVLPSWPVRIHGKTKSWKIDHFDRETGMENSIVRDRIDGKPVFRFENLGKGHFQILFYNGESTQAAKRMWDVSCQKDLYCVSGASAGEPSPAKPVAVIERSSGETWIPEINWPDVQPYFKVTIHDWSAKTEDEVLAILSLPSVLRFSNPAPAL